MSVVWIDIKNSHEPAFFKPFLNRFTEQEFFITSRKYAEIQKLLEQHKIKNDTIGRHYGGNIFKKMCGLFARDILLLLKTAKFDVSLSHGSINAIHAARMKFKPIISFYDNEKAVIGNKISFPFVDYLITPKAIPIDSLKKQGAKEECLIQYDGFKEDIYEADYIPDPNFLKNMPFHDFITIRPEALQAAYVKGKKTIVPDLLNAFQKNGINVLYLPRYQTDMNYAMDSNVYIPSEPLKGLDVCYYSRAILTGSGTFAREAACIGTPAVSFYPEELLSVDQKMVDDGWMLHSRDPDEILDYVLNTKKRTTDFSRSKRVQGEVFKIFGDIMDEIERKKGRL